MRGAASPCSRGLWVSQQTEGDRRWVSVQEGKPLISRDLHLDLAKLQRPLSCQEPPTRPSPYYVRLAGFRKPVLSALSPQLSLHTRKSKRNQEPQLLSKTYRTCYEPFGKNKRSHAFLPLALCTERCRGQALHGNLLRISRSTTEVLGFGPCKRDCLRASGPNLQPTPLNQPQLCEWRGSTQSRHWERTRH